MAEERTLTEEALENCTKISQYVREKYENDYLALNGELGVIDHDPILYSEEVIC